MKSVLAATATAGLISLDLSKQLDSPELSRSHARHLQLRNKVSEDLVRDPATAFTVNVEFGTPPQKMTMVVDTATNDIFPVLHNSASCSSSGPCLDIYRPDASSTRSTVSHDDVNGDTFFKFRSLAGGFTGVYLKDTVTVGSVTVKSQIFGAVGEPDTPVNVFGLGPSPPPPRTLADGRYSPHASFIDNLVKQGSINRRLFSLYLAGGNLLFGAVDTAKYYGKLISLPMVPAKNSTSDYLDFRVRLEAFSMPGLRNGPEIIEPTDVVLASGGDILYLGDKASILGTDLGTITSTTFGPLIDCNIAKTFNLTMQFRFAGGTIYLPGSSLVGRQLSPEQAATLEPQSQQQIKSWNGTCRFKIWDGAHFGPIILGIPFLENAYVVFDQDDHTVALAQARFGDSSKIVEVAKTKDFLNVVNEQVPQTVKDGTAPPPPSPNKPANSNGSDKDKDGKSDGMSVRVSRGTALLVAITTLAIVL